MSKKVKAFGHKLASVKLSAVQLRTRTWEFVFLTYTHWVSKRLLAAVSGATAH